MWGMVFAAGLGTRLRPLTDRLPKPVVPLFDRPLCAFAIERLAAAGVTHLAINTHHLAPSVRAALEGQLPEGMHVRFVHEPQLLGTGGGLKNAMASLRDEFGPPDPDLPIVVMNGDILFWPDIEAALRRHRELGALATLVLRADARARKLGALELDGQGRVYRLLGKPALPAMGKLAEYMFTGVHVLRARALTDLPDTGCIIRTSYRDWIDGSAPIAGVVDEGHWRDLGTPTDYLQAHLDLLDGHLRWPGRPLKDGEAHTGGWGQGTGGSWLHADAVVEADVQLRRCVLGAGAQVGAGRRLSRVVVWPGAKVDEDLQNAIVAPHATLKMA